MTTNSKNIYKFTFLSVLLSALFSISACGPDGNNGDDGPPPPPPTPEPTGFTTTVDANWNIVTQAPVARKVAFTGSKYIAIGDYGYYAESTDGQAWTESDMGFAVSFDDFAINDSTIVAVPRNDNDHIFSGYAVTTDGTSWQLTDSSSGSSLCGSLNSVVHDGTKFVGVFNDYNICTSMDGTTWELQSTQAIRLGKVAFGSGRYAFGIDGGLVTMSDINSTAMDVPSLPNATEVTQIVYGNSTFVARQGAGIIYSADGLAWSAASIDSSITKTSLSYSTDKGFITGDSYGNFYSSQNGIDWVAITDTGSLPQTLNTPIVVNGSTETLLFDNGITYRSTDQSTWSQITEVKPKGLIDSLLIYNNTQFVLSKESIDNGSYTEDKLYRSIDSGTNWTLVTDTNVGTIVSVIHDGTKFIVSGNTGISYSDDGISWTSSFTYKSTQTTASAKLGSTTYYFAGYAQALRSDDGESFLLETVPHPGVNGAGTTQDYKQAISDGSSSMVVTTTANRILHFDGTNWTTPVTDLTDSLNDVAWTGSSFVIVGDGGTIMTSADGEAWTTRSWINNLNITDVLVVGSNLYATDSNGNIASSSDDGVTWGLEKDFRATGDVITIGQLVHDGTNFYGFGTVSVSGQVSGMLVSSTDGTTWTTSLESFGTQYGLKHIIYDTDNSRFVTSLNNYDFNVSTDGSTWTTSSEAPLDPSFSWINVRSVLSNVSSSPLTYTSGTPDTYTSGSVYSEDGINWVIKTIMSAEEPAIDTSSLSNVVYSKYVNGQYLAFATGTIYTSSDASTWTQLSQFEVDSNLWTGQLTDIEYDGTQYVLMFTDIGSAEKGTMIATSTDLQSFTFLETEIRAPMSDLILETNGYTLIGDDGTIATRVLY